MPLREAAEHGCDVVEAGGMARPCASEPSSTIPTTSAASAVDTLPEEPPQVVIGGVRTQLADPKMG